MRPGAHLVAQPAVALYPVLCLSVLCRRPGVPRARVTRYIRGRPDPRSSVRCSYPPLVTALLQTVADSVQTCNASFASFSKLASLASFASIARAERCFGTRVQRFECRFEGFRDAPEILSKIFENLRQNLGPSKKTKIADGGENCGKPHWILWWTTWWPMDHGRRFLFVADFWRKFWSACGFFRGQGQTL